jgi:hypothetical protein
MTLLALSSATAACAGLEFQPTPQPDALTYYEPAPYLLVETAPDCSTKTSVVSLPGEPRSVRLKAGYGTSDLTVSLENGMITSVNQKVDTKIPETISAVSGAVKDVSGVMHGLVAGATGTTCTARTDLYPIIDGRVSKTAAFSRVPAARK